MKKFMIFILIIWLTSCGADTSDTQSDANNSITQPQDQEINSQENISDEDLSSSPPELAPPHEMMSDEERRLSEELNLELQQLLDLEFRSDETLTTE